MKNFTSMMILICFTVFLMPLASAQGQEVTIPEPEFINTAVYVEDNQPHRLEKAIPHDLNRRTIGSMVTGYHAAEMLKQVNDPASSFRIDSKDSYDFVVRVISNQFDPYEEIAIVRLEPTRKNRKYKIAGVDMLGQQKSGELDYIQFDGVKYGESSYHIKISQRLAPGEYAIFLRNSSDVLNCFGID